MSDLSEEELQELYAWIDDIPLTRQKKNIARDFSDAVLAAEVVDHFLPKLVDLHNYSPANAIQQKVQNWRTLNRKVFSRLNFVVPEEFLQGAAIGKQGVIEFILSMLRSKIEHLLRSKAARSNYASDTMFPPLLDSYQPEQMVTTYQPSAGLLWDGRRHTEPAFPGYDPDVNSLSHTYPTDSATHATRNSLLPSRIPLPSKKLYSHPEVDKVLPPLDRPVETKTNTTLPLLQKRATQYAHNKAAPSLHAKSRDSSAKYKLRLAEKDQKILETHEYIQMKLTRYEHLVQIKDMKIEELKKELETVKNGIGGGHGHGRFPLHQRR